MRNKILPLKDETGNLQYEQEEIKESILNYFRSLYISQHTQAPLHTTKPIGQTHTLSNSQRDTLDTPLRESEIKVIFAFNPFKAPGPDGLHPFFYQNYQSIVGKSVVDFCKLCFDTHDMHNTMNETLLCLILKHPQATMLKNSDP